MRKPWTTVVSLPMVVLAGCFWTAGSGGILPPGSSPPPLQATEWLQGEAPRWDQLRGNVVVLVAWAHWCGPCRAETPHLVEVYHQFQDQNVKFLGLTWDDDESSIRSTREFIETAQVPWPNGMGAGVTLSRLGVTMIPSLIVVGRDGLVTWNSDRPGTLEDALASALR